jgi:cyclophilin family peptidyl-prolyl cis-trans isomerase
MHFLARLTSCRLLLLALAALSSALPGCMGRPTPRAIPAAAVRPTSADTPLATLETSLGSIVVELFEDDAPNTVANFVSLAERGYYDGTCFHRVIRGFMMQGGDPNSRQSDPSTWGMGGPGYHIKDEPGIGRHRHDPGILSMANSGPNTGGSQFFILFGPASHLDGRHTIFGHVIDGLDVVKKFEAIGSDSRRGATQKSFPKLVSVRISRQRAHPYEPEKLTAQ